MNRRILVFRNLLKHPLPLTITLLSISFMVLLNVLWYPMNLLAQSEQEDQGDLLDKGDVAEFFEFGSGIFRSRSSLYYH